MQYPLEQVILVKHDVGLPFTSKVQPAPTSFFPPPKVTADAHVHEPAGTDTVSPVEALEIAVLISAAEQLAALIVAPLAFEVNKKEKATQPIATPSSNLFIPNISKRFCDRSRWTLLFVAKIRPNFQAFLRYWHY
jgi:hypothetical protein